jgi:hydroxyacylglutathione hydrolase
MNGPGQATLHESSRPGALRDSATRPPPARPDAEAARYIGTEASGYASSMPTAPRPEIVPVPQLSDNYAYLVVHPTTRDAIVIDPAEARPLLDAAEKIGASINTIFNTHHHWDHCGANEELGDATGAPVQASSIEGDKIPGLAVALEPGETIQVNGFAIRVLRLPGHTDGHVGYLFDEDLFCGDVLFVAGCGRIFEGTPAEMHASLNETIAALPDRVRIWCGHEYTVKNLEFAQSLEPENAAIAARLEKARAQRAAHQPTIPSTVGDERTFNPFFRVTSPELIATLTQRDPSQKTDPVSVFATVRQLKDNW